MIRTLNYGTLPIAKDETFLFNDVIDLIEIDDDSFFEVRKTLNGALVAVKVN